MTMQSNSRRKTRRSAFTSGRCGAFTSRQGSAFTLIEMIVATLIVSIAIVGVFGGIQALGVADTKAHTLELLQSLAADEMAQIGGVTDANSIDTSGNFQTEGYPNVNYTVDVETTDTENLDKITVTTTLGREQQSLTELLYVPATTGTSSGSTGSTTP